jgi:hypothetical protein
MTGYELRAQRRHQSGLLRPTLHLFWTVLDRVIARFSYSVRPGWPLPFRRTPSAGTRSARDQITTDEFIRLMV